MDPFTLALIMATIQAGSSAYGASRARGASSEAERRADLARQSEESQNILNSILSQLIPGSDEYNQFFSEALALARQTGDAGDQQDMIRQLGQRYVTQQHQRIAGGGAATPLEARTDLAFGGYRQANLPTSEERAVFNALRGIVPGVGEGSPLDAIFSDVVARAGDPSRFYTSTLAPSLQLAEDAVRRRAASRARAP